jgi:hypothetical protein
MAAVAISDKDTDASNDRDDDDEDNTYLAEFFNFDGDCIGTVEVKCTTTFIVYPVTDKKLRFFEVRELPEPKRLDGKSHNFYEIDEPVEGEYLPFSIRSLLDLEDDDTSPQGWRLWLDSDENKTVPHGFLGAKSSKEAMALVLEHGMPVVMDLEFDLGPDDSADRFLKELVKIVDFPPPLPPLMKIHTSNEVGRQWLQDYHETWRKAALNAAY